MSAGDNLFALASAKERAERTLAHAFGQGVLDEDGLDERMEALADADDLATVEALTVDLELPPQDALAMPERSDPSRALARIEDVEAERQIVTVFGEHQQRGPWTPARRNRVMTVFGSAKLDLREAYLSEGVTEIEVRCAFADLTIIVPPELAVDVQCNAILSSVEHDERYADFNPAAPRLRITGWAVLSNLEVKERARGEGSWQARKRRKKERKRLKERRRRRALPEGRRDT